MPIEVSDLPRAGTGAAPGRWHESVTRWIARRSFPLLAAAVLIAIGMASSTWWGPHIAGSSHWQLPDDIRGTLLAARRLLHLDIGGLYTRPTGLVSFPGTAVVLVPVVALLDALGLGLGLPGPHNPHPGWWLAAGPYQIALSSIALLAADAIAERSGVSRPKRFLLAAAQAVALWNVSARWGHPEDAVAVALLLYGVLALSDGRTSRSAWLVGAAVAVQPLVLLALPVIVIVLEPKRRAGYLLKAAIPAAVLLGAALAANWTATVHAVGDQPNWPTIDHPTPWVAFASPAGHGAVAAGPARAVAILLACACAVVARRSWRTAPAQAAPSAARTTPSASQTTPSLARTTPSLARTAPSASQATPSLARTTPSAARTAAGAARTAPRLQDLLWWIALALAIRCVVESVMVAYYVWPALAVALASATARWSRLVAAAVFSSALTFLAQLPWPGRWGWWAMVLAGLFLVLAAARGRRTSVTTS